MSLLVLRVLYLVFSSVFERPVTRKADAARSQAPVHVGAGG